MNGLKTLLNMGFKITWNLIYIGLHGLDEIPVQISFSDVVEYIKEQIGAEPSQTDAMAALLCEKDDEDKFNKVLQELSLNDYSDPSIQKRKWRAYMLKKIIENGNEDYFMTMLALIEFWCAMGTPDGCPLTYPVPGDKESAKNFFTHSSYTVAMTANRTWLDREISDIITMES